MKRIIGGLRYDTDKADCLGMTSAECSRTEFQWHETALYRSKNGRYFLSGQGGAMSMWSEPGASPGEKRGGSGIKPLSFEEARTWAEQNLKASEVEEVFENNIQDA